MSENEKRVAAEPDFTPREQGIRRDLAALERPRPGAEFRERVRAQFTHPPVMHADEPRSRSYRKRLWVGFAVAATLTILLFGLTTRPSWELAAVDPGTTVRLNGEIIAGDALIGRPLPRSSRIQNAGPGNLRLQVDGALSVVLTPDTDAVIGVRRELFGSPTLLCEVVSGHLRGTTGSAFPDGGLDVRTSEATVHVSGTTFGIIKRPESTCICVYEGTVRLEEGIGVESATAIPAGQRYTVGPAEPDTERMLPLTADEVEQLGLLCTLGVPGDRRQ